MNKHIYCTIFNKTRGLVMVVAEISHLQDQGKVNATHGQSTPSIKNDNKFELAILPLKNLQFAIGLTIGTAFIPANATSGGIVADSTAAITQQATILKTSNNILQVNIQTPSAAGVSRNTYSQFNVPQQGAILNNARIDANTQLGGWVTANPWLAAGTARVILNEVNANNPSLLQGYVEVAGNRAQVVIANPAGVTCSGCGFINTSRGVLTTGQAILKNGALDSYRVQQGTITIDGDGLDASQTDYTDLIARTVEVNAGIWANELSVITGSNQVNASNTQVTKIASTTPAPTTAIDVASLGGMYAGKIKLVGTQAGVGVRNAGQIGASAGEFILSANGDLINTGLINSTTNSQITTTGTINNSGTLYAQGDVLVTTPDNISNSGVIVSQGAIMINADNVNNASGTLASESTIGVVTNSLNNQLGRIEALSDVAVELRKNMDNRNGFIRSGQSLSLSATSLDNNNTLTANQGLEGDAVFITATSLDNTLGAIRANTNLSFVGSDTLNNSQGLISSAGSLALFDPTAIPNSNTSTKTLDIINTQGTVIANESLSINSKSLTGDGAVLSGGDLSAKLLDDYTHTTTAQFQANSNALLETSGALHNEALLAAGDNLNLNAATIENSSDGEIIATTLELTVTLPNTLINRGLIDGVDILIDTATLNNIGTGRIYGDHLAIQGETLNNSSETLNGITTSAIIAARERLDLGVVKLLNRDNALIFSGGDLAIGRALDSNHFATGSADSIINSDADVESLGSVFIAALDVQNLNTNLIVKQVDEATVYSGEVLPNGSTNRYGEQTCSGIGGGQDKNSCTDRPGTFEDYTWFRVNATPSHTEVASSDPAHISAGADILINGNLTNQDSSIIAGGVINVVGGSVDNLATQGQDVTNYSNGTSQFTWIKSCGTFGNKHCRSWSGISSYNPAPIYGTPYDLPTLTFSANTSPVSSGIDISPLTLSDITDKAGNTVTPSTLLPNNSLFNSVANTNNRYLVETDLQFSNYRNWLSSDYMLTALSYDPALSQKRLGDGFYEQRLLREQVAQLTGRRFLDGYASNEAQYQALMNNGITVAKQWNLRPGVTLSAAQVAQLTSDIVWLVEKDITLADGSTVKALAPQLYARLAANDLLADGSLIAANTLNFTLTDDLTNSGTIAGREVVTINAENIQNLGGRIDANTALLNSRRDINNIGGTLSAQDTLLLNAGNDIRVETTTRHSQSISDNNTFTRTTIERVAGLYVSNPNALLVANAGNNINLIAAELNNTGTNSQTTLTADHDIVLDTVTIAKQENTLWDKDNYLNEGYHRDVGTQLQSQGDVTLQADHNVSSIAASVNAGQLSINAVNDVDITAGKDSSNFNEAHKIKSSGFLSSKTTVTRHTLDSTIALSSTLSADTIELSSGNNLSITGSNIVATDDVSLSAGNDITIDTAKQSFSETNYSKTKRSGFMGTDDGFGFTVGHQQLITDNKGQKTINFSSTVGSVEGDVSLNAGKHYTQRGSHILTPQGNVAISAQQVDIMAAMDTDANEQHTQFKRSGISVSLTSPVISAIQTTSQMKTAASQTDDARMKALAAGTAALSFHNAYDTVKAGQAIKGANAADQVGGINISISLGKSKSSSSARQISSTAQSSTIIAGGDIAISANGSREKSDINIIGSQLKASNNLTLNAQDQTNLLAAKNISTFNSENSSSSSSIGIGFALGDTNNGFTINAGLSGGQGNAAGDDMVYTPTLVNAANTVNLKSGSNTTLNGASVEARQVIANIGTSGEGNLAIVSVQDSHTYNSEQDDFGVGVTLCIPPFCYGTSSAALSISDSDVNSDYTSVTQQSGIKAGDGGFQIDVNGNTDLTGAVIASTDTAIDNNKNQLTTQTLTVSDIENKAEYDAKSMGASLAIGEQLDTSTLTGSGIGKDSGNSQSVTKTAISEGKIAITDNQRQISLSGNNTDTSVAQLNRDVVVDENGNTVNASGANTVQSINTIFDAEKVAKEIQAQTRITQAFSQQASTAVTDYTQNLRKTLQDQLKQSNSEENTALIESQLAELFLEEKVMNVLIGAVTGLGSVALSKESLSIAADKMRILMIEDSELFAGITDGITTLDNISADSEGVRGDGKKVGGTRVDLDKLCGSSNERCKTNPDGNLSLNDKGQVHWDLKKIKI